MGMLKNDFPKVEKAIKEFRNKIWNLEDICGQFDVNLEVGAFTHNGRDEREQGILLADSLLNRKVTITFNLYAKDDDDE